MEVGLVDAGGGSGVGARYSEVSRVIDYVNEFLLDDKVKQYLEYG
jgi:hypothetical protein